MTCNKRPFETLLRTALREHPELLAGLNFGEPKRAVADRLVDRLVSHEQRYQEVTLRLMLEIASMTTFTNIEQLKDPGDRALRLGEARAAVERLRADRTVRRWAGDSGEGGGAAGGGARPGRGGEEVRR